MKLLRRRRKKKEEKIKQKEYYYLLKSNVSYFKSIFLFIKFIYTCLCTLHVRLLSRTITIRNCTRMYVYVNLSLFVFLDLYFYISILARKKTSTCFRTLVLHLSLIILNVHLCVHVIFLYFLCIFLTFGGLCERSEVRRFCPRHTIVFCVVIISFPRSFIFYAVPIRCLSFSSFSCCNRI